MKTNKKVYFVSNLNSYDSEVEVGYMDSNNYTTHYGDGRFNNISDVRIISKEEYNDYLELQSYISDKLNELEILVNDINNSYGLIDTIIKGRTSMIVNHRKSIKITKTFGGDRLNSKFGDSKSNFHYWDK